MIDMKQTQLKPSSLQSRALETTNPIFATNSCCSRASYPSPSFTSSSLLRRLGRHTFFQNPWIIFQDSEGKTIHVYCLTATASLILSQNPLYRCQDRPAFVFLSGKHIFWHGYQAQNSSRGGFGSDESFQTR